MTKGDTGRKPVRNREWIAELLERVEMVEWDRFVLGKDANDEDIVEVYGWIERAEDEYKDFVLAQFWPHDEEMMYTTSSDRYTEELQQLWFGEDSLDDHAECRRVEHAFDVSNAVELGEQTTLVTDGGTDTGDIERFQACEECGGEVDTHESGYWKAPNDEQFWHEGCYDKIEKAEELAGCIRRLMVPPNEFDGLSDDFHNHLDNAQASLETAVEHERLRKDQGIFPYDGERNSRSVDTGTDRSGGDMDA